MKFTLERVHYMPKDLKPGVLYVSEEFDIAIHLCACGCGSKVKTPLGPTEWLIEETKRGPTLRPSVGNWHQACRSHYNLDGGEIIWAKKWTPEQIASGRRLEEERRRAYYDALDRKHRGMLQSIWFWLKRLFRD
ncbi:MAG: hypothetical protein EHM18_00335 [Acidobacteria bacterium]|nr:MAG: hypothetical protein EHM18_00335 [Acidobacteriota bacterium]